LAEFDNFRKRSRGELDQARDAALDSVLVNLLPVLDDLDRMLSGWGAGDDAHRKGVELIRAKFWAYFSARGVQRMESLGMMFDAAEHEALAMQPTADFPPHTVMAVIAPGYRRAERVLRHAQVIVSSDVTSLNEGN
jgi:molecular chaperone GrpE